MLIVIDMGTNSKIWSGYKWIPKVVGYVTSYKSCIWNEQYYGFDEFELNLPFSAEMVNTLQVGRVLVRMDEIKKNTKGHTGGVIFNPILADQNDMWDVGVEYHPMLIETIEISDEEETGKMIKVSGRGCKAWYNRRAVSTQNVSKGEIGEVLSEQNNIIFRLYEFVEGRFLVGGGAVYLPQFSAVCYDGEDFDLREKNWKFSVAKKPVESTSNEQKAGDWICAAAEAYGFGWTVACLIEKGNPEQWNGNVNNIAFVLAPYAGLNLTGDGQPVVGYDITITRPPVKFTKNNEMLLKSKYTYSKREYANKVTIFGEGQGLSQTIESYTTDPDADGLDLYEEAVDGSGVRSDVVILEPEYRALLRAYGKEQIAAKGSGFSFECDINQYTAMLIYGDGHQELAEVTYDYGLGDRVEVENELGILATAQITEMIHSEDESGFKIVPTFGEWKIS